MLQLAALRAERARWTALEESKASLEEEVALWRSRYHQAAGRSDELASNVARLESELLASKLEVLSHPPPLFPLLSPTLPTTHVGTNMTLGCKLSIRGGRGGSVPLGGSAHTQIN